MSILKKKDLTTKCIAAIIQYQTKTSEIILILFKPLTLF